MWIEITDEGGTRMINMDRVEIVCVENVDVVLWFTGQDCESRFVYKTECEAQAEYERIKGLLMEGHKCRACK